MPIETSSPILNIPSVSLDLPALILSIGIKIVLLIIVFIYGIFSVLIIRQVRTMEKTLTTPLSGVITLVAVLHSLAALLLFLAIFISL